MFLILIKLSIHMARIGLLYSIDDKDPSYILESIGRVESIVFLTEDPFTVRGSMTFGL